MADEEEPISPYSSRERRHRRRHSASTSEDVKKTSSSLNILAPTASKEPVYRENGHHHHHQMEKESHTRKKRPSRRQTPEPADISADSRENINAGRSERRRPRKQQTAQRLPRSVSEEVLALEGKFQAPLPVPDVTGRPPQPDKRSRRGRRKNDPELHHQVSSEVYDEEQNTESIDNPNSDRLQSRSKPRGSQPKKKKKMRSSMLTSGDEDNYQGDMDGEVSEIFRIDKEDIIQSDVNHSTGKIATINQVNQSTLPSQPQDFLFIEKKDGQGFLKVHKSKLEQVIEEPTVSRTSTTMEFALQVHNGFQTIALICHGLLAGITLTQCIFVYSLSDQSYVNFLINYHKLALPFQSVYYFLLAFCVVSIFDRYINVSVGWSQFFLALLSRPSRALAIVGYLFALVFSVSLAQLDDKIGLYKETPSLWASTSQLSIWRIINLFRVIGAILGWFAVSLNPLDDQAAKNLKQAVERERAETKSNLKSATLASWETHPPI